MAAGGQGGQPHGVSQVRSGGRLKCNWDKTKVEALIPLLKKKYYSDGGRFYIPSSVYKDDRVFTPAHKQAAYQIRQSLKGSATGGPKSGGTGGGKGGDAAASNRAIKTLTSSVDSLMLFIAKGKGHDFDSDDDNDNDSKRMSSDASASSKRSNQGHPALCRPNKLSKK